MAEETRQGAYTERSPFYFQGSMDEQTLRRYTARAVTYQTLCDCETDIEEGLRLVTHVGAKFIGRAAHFSWKGNWTREQIEAYYALAARLAARAHEADPELIIQAGVFEIIYRGTVEAQPVPPEVFAAFGLPAENRCFDWERMLFPENFAFGDATWKNWGGRDFWAREAAWPFIGSVETQMYFYYSITRWIDAGFEAIHLGQAEKMMGCRPEYLPCWDRVTALAREYAKTHARRGIVLFDCHTVLGGTNMKMGDRLLLDIVGAAMVPWDDRMADGVRTCRIGDYTENACTWVGRSPGGRHPLGFTCETLPTMLELDNYGRPGPVGEWNDNYSPWGYDDITWFALQPEHYRNAFLLYCDRVLTDVRRDRCGQAYFLQPQLRRCLCCSGDEPRMLYRPGDGFDPAYFEAFCRQDHVTAMPQNDGSYQLIVGKEYRANTPSDACPTGFGQEETIRQIFSRK